MVEAGVADGLAERGIATMRYQFPYMEQGSKRPDAQTCPGHRPGGSQSSHLVPKLALIAGGKSFGGRMTSQAQAALPLSGVRALVFLGFPLHPAGRPSDERADHLFEVKFRCCSCRELVMHLPRPKHPVDRWLITQNTQSRQSDGSIFSCRQHYSDALKITRNREPTELRRVELQGLFVV